MTFLDRLLEPFPWVKTALPYIDQYMGPVIGILLLILILLIFYWSFVVVPKKVHRLFTKLAKSGYSRNDPTDPHLSQIVAKLAPLYNHHPLKGHPIPPWKIITALSNSSKGGTRYLIYASRLQVEPAGSGLGTSNSLRHCIMILEDRKLDFPEAVYVKSSANAENTLCDGRHNLLKVAPDHKTPFFDHYAFFTKSGAMETFPAAIQETLTSLLPLFLLQESHTTHIWGANLKFSEDGWGLLSSEEIYKPDAMDKFIEAASQISDALY